MATRADAELSCDCREQRKEKREAIKGGEMEEGHGWVRWEEEGENAVTNTWGGRAPRRACWSACGRSPWGPRAVALRQPASSGIVALRTAPRQQQEPGLRRSLQ